VARPVEFDRSRAVNKALVLFWRKGYQASSLADLLAAMGIGRSSFYAAFTDKRTLFLECVDLFAARTVELVQRARSEMPPVDALQHFFERNFIGVPGSGVGASTSRHWGCMLVNTVIEMAAVDDGLAQHASRHLGELQRIFEECLREAGAGRDHAQELAAMLMLINEGIRVSSRRQLPDRQYLRPISTTFGLIRSAVA
jgi:TetR/AcrR family transcriptional repressor of nem operon